MYIINATKAQVRLPIKSLNQVIVLAAGEKSPHIDDKVHNEIIPLIRAFKLTVEGYGAANAGGVDRAHAGAVIHSDPKANSGDYQHKARQEAANNTALAKAKAVTDAVAANRAANEKTAAAKAEAEKVEAEKAAAAKVEAEKVEAEKAAAAKAEAEKSEPKTVVRKTASKPKSVKKPTPARARRKPSTQKSSK